jgi:hypothetical protein
MAAGGGDDPLLSDHLSKRDKAALHRLLKKFSEPEFDALIAQERSRLDDTTKSKGGAPRSPKAQQALLVALCLARYFHAPISVRGAAQEIYDVVDITIIRPRKHGLPNVRNIKSVRALHEDLRIGLKSNDLQTVATMMAMLVWWRRTHKNPKWGVTSGSPKQTVSISPKKPARLIRWIDALISRWPTLDRQIYSAQK